jgi:hypothetical protein
MDSDLQVLSLVVLKLHCIVKLTGLAQNDNGFVTTVFDGPHLQVNSLLIIEGIVERFYRCVWWKCSQVAISVLDACSRSCQKHTRFGLRLADVRWLGCSALLHFLEKKHGTHSRLV